MAIFNQSNTSTAFGVLPLQRVDFDTVKEILLSAYPAAA